MTGTPFADLDAFLKLPRVSGLVVSPDGRRVVTMIGELNDKGTEYVTAAWEIDPDGHRAARRLTRGAKGESQPAFTAAGDLLFVAARPAESDADAPAALWQLPAEGGEARRVLELSGGISDVHTARSADVVVVTSPMHPSAETPDEDKRMRTLRKDNKVSAIMHTGYPVRHWDHDLGPDHPHLLRVESGVAQDITPQPGLALGEAAVDISADGGFAVTSWEVPFPGAAVRSLLVRVDIGTGERGVLAEDPAADLGHPAISPDGTAVAFIRETHSTPEHAPRITLCRQDFDGEMVELTAHWDRWPTSVTWSHDGASLLVTADDNGRAPIFRVHPDTGDVTAVTHDDFAYSDVRPVAGGALFALRSSYLTPPHPVRVDADGSVVELPCVELPQLPGGLVEVTAEADDGSRVRSWMTVPAGDRPAPLLLWVHGGPLGSWNTWHWRWNPWLLTACGYAVLMPDPALSTGYGQDFIQRGWGSWGFAPFADLMAAVDAACEHPRVDAGRIAAMGGSFGGYMANWIAGHTDRFAAIVTHASLWALDQFGPTTDGAYWWAREMTPEMAERNTPHRHVENITTPMLVIHGDKDYRVPIGEGLRLWNDLLTRSGLPADENGDTVHRYLYYPSEGHWILAPQHAKIWYQVVLAFLSEHVLGEAVALPEMLG
ncbi:S9 family peptidase [Mycobacterium sp. CBMA293]|uniref:S9 family peptidase n=1 Tax=unclassified Mycolicibacterium TaxID=2636767 RepID=UPI0012DD6568|nr:MULTISPECIES: alpha/beta fold hydrolase [unclassified Mycolicibacterium]MUL49198.1 S9 family peptidase [Mycolicibacterium sp. CBMA 360]MUL60770.1 S9 family peptidase [Mycolicibacterium sp. CBMA 335]MUL71783.1 S9 family peptidase [Mycolicibacterium sp. CBMA 311]MUL95711.1 S9 family peptidase [Mycolicibacterium sp. CBMA 230]MUM03547.1 S9 family peptidase [Mycolicibacterium sp. CBMA 213]